MPKASSSLTGGTGDVNPQWFRGAASTTSTTPATAGYSNTVSVQTPVPINRLKQQGGKTIVMELLKVRWSGTVNYPLNAAQNQFALRFLSGFLATAPPASASIGLSTVSPYQVSPTDPKIVDFWSVAHTLSFNLTGTALLNNTSGPLLSLGIIPSHFFVMMTLQPELQMPLFLLSTI